MTKASSAPVANPPKWPQLSMPCTEKPKGQIQNDERDHSPPEGTAPARGNYVAVNVAGNQHRAGNPENGPGSSHRDVFRNRHGKECAAHAGGHINRGVAAIAIHAFQDGSQDNRAQ